MSKGQSDFKIQTYFMDKMLLNASPGEWSSLDEERRSFLAGAGEQVTNVDDDVDDSTENDLALNVDHIFEADECDAFDSDVDEGPTSQTMFMASLTSEDPIYDEAGPSYDSNNPFEVQDHDAFVDHMDEYHDVHEMQNDVQHNYVVDSDADYTSDSNIIPYDQYVEDNEEHVVQCNASSVQSRLTNKPDMLINDSVTSELARYKELVGEYEKRAKFELTDRERKIDEQMRIIISDRNRKETSLKSELHSAQILLSSTVDHYKSKTEEVKLLKKDFKQKEDKFLEEFLDLKKIKDKIEDRLYKQGQSAQTVHMLCQPKSFYDEKHKVAIGYKKQAQSAVYNGHMPVIHDSEDTRELAEITRKRMLLKMQSPLCVENKIRISPPDYSKENLLATFAPQRNLTPEQIFWSIDDNRKKAETLALKPISALTVYPPNTPVKLVPRILPTKSQVKINLYVLTQLFTEFDKTCKTRITPSGLTEGEREFCRTSNVLKLKEKLLLSENEILIDNCLSTQLLYDLAKSSCLELEADVSKVHDETVTSDSRKGLTVIGHLKDLVTNVNDRSREPYSAVDVTALIEQNNCDRLELEKVKQHYKELFDSLIKILVPHTSVKKDSYHLNEIVESKSSNCRSKAHCFTSGTISNQKFLLLACCHDVKTIPHPLKNNRMLI
ncbi:hypothetical protein Tco_0966934 [Tanacetum coccineum]